LYDYFGGVADLEGNQLRWLGCVRDRIVENPLRILRFFRFHARIADHEPHDLDVLLAMASEAHRLHLLSGEVVWKNFKQIVKASSARATSMELHAMLKYGFLRELLPHGLRDDAYLDVDAALRMRALQDESAGWLPCGKSGHVNPVLTVVELFRRNSIVLKELACAWKWSCDEVELGLFLCDNLNHFAPSLEESRCWLRVRDHFEPQTPQISQLKHIPPSLCLREWFIAQSRFSELEALEMVQPANFPVDTMRKLGLPKLSGSTHYKEALRRVKQLWVDSNCRLSASELLLAQEVWTPGEKLPDC